MTQRKKLYTRLMLELKASELAYFKMGTQYTLPANHCKIQGEVMFLLNLKL